MFGAGTAVVGGRTPGSSFKVYTLAAGLQEDLSFDSIWDTTLKRPNGRPINNPGAAPATICKNHTGDCDLETATIKSYNFPFYWLADQMGRDKVIAAAKAAGIQHMYTDGNKQLPNGRQVDLSKTDKSTWLKQGYFDNEVAFGQYRVVPLEHAEGVATIVNNGVHHDAHFVTQVRRGNPEDGQIEVLKAENSAGNQVFQADTMSNLQGVMAKIVKADSRNLDGGREGIAKSGTWEYNDGKDKHTGSGDCWFVGGIPQLAVTVWVGGKNNKVELHDPNSSSRFKDMFGAGVPSKIWRQFLNDAADAKDWNNKDFPERIDTGIADKFGNGVKPVVVTPP